MCPLPLVQASIRLACVMGRAAALPAAPFLLLTTGQLGGASTDASITWFGCGSITKPTVCSVGIDRVVAAT
jgi:hypothetical protein